MILWLTSCFAPTPSNGEPPRARAHGRERGERALELVAIGPDAHGEARSFYVHVPDGAKGPLPAIFVFHGGVGKDGREIARQWRDELDKGMILVFPNGQKEIGDEGGFVAPIADRYQVENVQRIVKKVVAEYGADPSRLYAVGFSGGAEMIDQLACRAPDEFRALGHIGRTLLREQMEACPHPTTRPQIMMAGTADERAPFEGKLDPDGKSYRQVPAMTAWDFWLGAAGCAVAPQVETLPDRGDRAEIEVRTWTACTNAAGMRFVTMRGVGHGWPDGGAGRDPAAEGGRVRDIDATEAFLSFFREFGGL